MPTPTTPFTNLDLNDCGDKMTRLLGSQQAFYDFPRPQDITEPGKTIFEECLCGGWASGKTLIGIYKGLVLSALFPKNQGLIGRFHGKDLEDSVIPLFFELCPESWIRNISMRGRTGMNVLLKNGSLIYFRHIHDAGGSQGKTRRVGANLGWYFISQIEEIEEAHWMAMHGRLRNPRALIKLAMGDANPNGRNWVQKKFFPNYIPLTDGTFFRTYQRGSVFGVHVNSEENRVSNGGFIEDDYYESKIATFASDVYERYIQGSMENFSGKIYKEYNTESIHNIVPFSIPRHWECTVAIDVGGSCPWAVVPGFVDERGNIIVTETFDKATGRTAEVASWIKSNTPWNENRTTFVIDPENKVAAVELGDHGIWCSVAQKEVLPTILQVTGYMHIRQGKTELERKIQIPDWFRTTQPKEAVQRAEQYGLPRLFVFNTAQTWRTEHDEATWDDKIPNQIKKTATKRFDQCFVADTPVLMADGSYKSIAQISVGEKVWTRQGTRYVLAVGCTQQNADTWRLTLSNGTYVIATPEHKVWTVGNGWRRLDALRYGDEVLTCDQNPYFTEALSSDFTKTSTTIGRRLMEGIGKSIITSGFATQARSCLKRVFTYTTKITARTTIDSPIWRNLLPQLTLKNMLRTLLTFAPWLHSGTVPAMEYAGIGNRGEGVWHIDGPTLKQSLAGFVEKSSLILRITSTFAQTIANRLGGVGWGSTTFKRTALCVEPNSQATVTVASKPAPSPVVVVSSQPEKRADVYCLEVDRDHEFYAAGILVKNCDGTRYLLAKRPLASNLPSEDKFSDLREKDPYSASEAEACDREIAAIIEEQRGNNSREACYDLEVVHETQGGRGKYDWAN